MDKSLRKFTLLILLFLSLVSACAPASGSETDVTEQVVVEPTLTATSEPTATPSPTPTPLPLGGQQTEYHIDATINYYNRFISVTSRSVYTNKTNTPIPEMVFIVYPAIFNAVYIRSVELGDGTPVENRRWESHRVIIPLDTPLQPGEQIEIIFDYELYMPDRDGVFGQTGRQLLLSYWYPTIPPYDEEQGWLAYEVSIINSDFVGEYQTFESADFFVNVSFTDRGENLDIAAGAIPEMEDGKYHFHLPLARTFVMGVSDSYNIIEREWNGVLVRGYTLPEVEETAQVLVDLAKESLQLYSELFSPYERDLISIVQVDMFMNMEFDGIIMIQSSYIWTYHYHTPPRTSLHIIVPHEISHQWFFGLVGNNQAIEPWLDEAFATYAEALFYEYQYPEDLEWWWQERVFNHLPTGTIDTDIYLSGGLPEYMHRVYRRGALFTQELRDMIGDEVFFDFVRAYIDEYRYDIATGEGFWNLLLEHTDADLTPLLDTYFSDPPVSP